MSSIYLSSPVNALVEGIYQENVSFSQVKQHGDFSLGTFNELYGEMVMLDGTIYQIDSSGYVRVIDDTAQTPFAAITFFHPATYDWIDCEIDYEGLIEMLMYMIPSLNIFYAIRIDGLFSVCAHKVCAMFRKAIDQSSR